MKPTAALITDLKARGLLEDTLVVCGGEFGRTVYAQGPLQDNYGRDHHGGCFTMWLAGAGVRGGMLYGESDKDAAYPKDKPTSPEDLAATIFHALGVDPEIRLPDRQGRPVQIIAGGRVLEDVFG